MFTCGLERSNFSFDIFSSSIYIRIPNYSVTLEPAMRFELMTSSLPRRRSTPELRGPESQSAKNWSGRRDSNSRPSAWKADALPTELHPPKVIANCRFPIANLKELSPTPQLAIGNLKIGNAAPVQGVGFEPT